MVVLDFCRRLINKLSWAKPTLYTFYGVFAITYIAAMIGVFVECQPFEKYWQIAPDPGSWYD